MGLINLRLPRRHARISPAGPRPSGDPAVHLDTPLLRLSRSRLAPILALGLFVWLGYLILSPLPYNRLNVYHQTVVDQLLLVIAGLAYLAHLAYHRRLPGPTRLDWAIGAVLCAYGLAIALSIYPRFSIEAGFLVGWVVLTFYVFHDIDELTAPVLIRGLAAVGVAAAIYALYRVGADYAAWLHLVSAVEGKVALRNLLPPSVPRVHDAGDHVNMIALAFNLTLPFVLVLVLESGSRIERILAALGAAAVILALFFTVSRAAWVSSAVALPLFALLYHWRDHGLPPRPRPRLSGGLIAVSAVLVLLAVGAAGAVTVARWDSRPEWLFRSSLSPRYDAFNVALDIIRDQPWTGAGPNTYSLLYNVYSGDYPIEDFHPHNGYLAVGVDTGLVGAAAIFMLALVLLRTLIATYVVGSPERRVWVAACLAALTALAVHSAADMPNQSKTALLLLAVIAALSMKLSRPQSRPPRLVSPGNTPRLLILAFVPLFLGAWLWTDLGHDRYYQSLHLLNKGDLDGAVRQSLDAARLDPAFSVYHLHAGVTQAIDYLVKQDHGATTPELLDGAIASLRRAVDLEPRGGIGHANLAIALRMDGQRNAAVEEARLAMARSPGDGAISAVAGTIFEWADMPGDALYAYTNAVTHDAGLIDSPFWEATEFRRDARETIVAHTFLSPCQKARVVAMYRGYPDDLEGLAGACATEVASSNDPRRRSDLAVALASLGRIDDAKRAAQAAVDHAPDNAFARTALAIAKARDASLDEVRHQLMLAADLGDPDAALLLYYTFNQAPPALAANLSLPFKEGATPDDVKDRLEAALPLSGSLVYDQGIQDYLLGILYYRPRFFRESPTSILIPGDWIDLSSPRTLLIQKALHDAGRR